MAKRILLRRGTTNQTNAFTGGLGEVTVDTDKDVLVVHDGSTAGGFPVAARANNDTTVSIISKTGKILATIPYAGLLDNTLTSTATDQALTTAQGKVLKDLVDTKLASTANAVSATKLVTARTLNGVSFDGTANISVPALITAIAASSNLNDYTTAGFYACSTNAVAGGLTNTPTGNAFALLVEKSAGTIQTLTEYLTASPKTFRRNEYGGTWGSWYQVMTSLGGTFTGSATFNGGLTGTTGSFSSTLNGNALGVINTNNSSGLGLSLYGSATAGLPSYGIAFSGIPTYGAFGAVTGDWATYFTVDGATNRGWIFRNGANNVASISCGGIMASPMYRLTTSYGSENYIGNGTGDGASYTTHNLTIRSWYGIGFHDNADNCRAVLNTRTGDFNTTGTVTAGAFSGNASSATRLSSASGDAPCYAARAFVNFTGAGTVTNYRSGNVSSIADNGTGNYTINFVTAMPDTYYSWFLGGRDTDNAGDVTVGAGSTSTKTVWSLQILVGSGTSRQDFPEISLVVFA